jgi:hypothetical protein
MEFDFLLLKGKFVYLDSETPEIQHLKGVMAEGEKAAECNYRETRNAE